MDWQEFVALAVVILTAALFAWGGLRRRARNALAGQGCGAGCGCSGASAAPMRSAPTSVWRARRGERPEVRVKLPKEPALRKTTN